MEQQLTNLFIELLEITTCCALTIALLSICMNIYNLFRLGEKLQRMSIYYKVALPYGAYHCGWLYLLKYKDAVQPHYNTLATILAVLTVIAVIYIAVVVYRYVRHKK